jgi:hypothetical protein
LRVLGGDLNERKKQMGGIDFGGIAAYRGVIISGKGHRRSQHQQRGERYFQI